MRTVDLMGVHLHALTEAECIDFILQSLAARRGGWLVTMNLNHLRSYFLVSDYRRVYQQATLIVPDGMPLLWASRIKGTPLPQRVTGSNLIWSLTRAAAADERSVFLLGGAPTVATAAAAILKQHNPTLRIAGIYSPPFGFENQPDSLQVLLDTIIPAAPDIVYVALGTPKEDRTIEQIRSRLPHTFFIGVGASFDFVAGTLPRAPRWMQQMGLEWLHRLLNEPRRLTRRYLLEGLPFLCRLMWYALRQRILGKSNEHPEG